jgi:CheY-like chemotaxis protein
MDAHMPNMNGFDAIRAIRAHEHGSGVRIPIIMLTASVLESDRKSCLDAGADAFVPKPIDFRLLFDRIADFFPVVDGPAEAVREAPLPKPSHDLGLIDEVAGIQNWGDPELYFAWLLRLAEDHPNMHQTIARLARDESAQEAIEYLHKLKGLMGNLRIRRLPQLCADIEQALKAQGSWPADLLDELQGLEVSLRVDIDKLRTAAKAGHGRSASGVSAPGIANGMDIDVVESLLAQIIASLEAGEVNDAALASLRVLMGHDQTASLTGAVAEFDFTTAIQAAKALADRIDRKA